MSKFKIGDRVIVIRGLHADEKGVITEITPPPLSTHVVEIDGTGYGYFERDLKLDEEEMVKVYGADFGMIAGLKSSR